MPASTLCMKLASDKKCKQTAIEPQRQPSLGKQLFQWGQGFSKCTCTHCPVTMETIVKQIARDRLSLLGVWSSLVLNILSLCNNMSKATFDFSNVKFRFWKQNFEQSTWVLVWQLDRKSLHNPDSPPREFVPPPAPTYQYRFSSTIFWNARPMAFCSALKCRFKSMSESTYVHYIWP